MSYCINISMDLGHTTVQFMLLLIFVTMFTAHWTRACTTLKKALDTVDLLGSIAGPFLFLILINILFQVKNVNTILYADDMPVQVSGCLLVPLYDRMNFNLKRMDQWFQVNFLTLNASKTKYMLFCNTKQALA